MLRCLLLERGCELWSAAVTEKSYPGKEREELRNKEEKERFSERWTGFRLVRLEEACGKGVKMALNDVDNSP